MPSHVRVLSAIGLALGLVTAARLAVAAEPAQVWLRGRGVEDRILRVPRTSGCTPVGIILTAGQRSTVIAVREPIAATDQAVWLTVAVPFDAVTLVSDGRFKAAADMIGSGCAPQEVTVEILATPSVEDRAFALALFLGLAVLFWAAWRVIGALDHRELARRALGIQAVTEDSKLWSELRKVQGDGIGFAATKSFRDQVEQASTSDALKDAVPLLVEIERLAGRSEPLAHACGRSIRFGWVVSGLVAAALMAMPQSSEIGLSPIVTGAVVIALALGVIAWVRYRRSLRGRS